MYLSKLEMPDADDPPPTGQRRTGNVPRPFVHETSDPQKRPVAQWVISGSVARPAHEVLPDPATGALPARPTTRPALWMLAVAAAAGFAVAVPLTWLFFSIVAR